jgi:hypothetical protein
LLASFAAGDVPVPLLLLLDALEPEELDELLLDE